MAARNTFKLLESFGYDPVDIESDADYIRALKESFNELQIKDPSDPRLIELADAIKGFRRAKSEKEAAKSDGKSRAAKRRKPKLSEDEVKAEIDAKEKKKKDAMNFISPGSAVPELPPAESDGDSDISGALMKISNDVNIIKGIVAAENKIEEDKADDTREAREKKKRSMRENIMEGGKGGFKKVTGAVGKILSPAKGIFSKIFDFLKLFILGSGLMKILDWMGNPDNASKLDSIFRFLKDYWPAIITALMAFVPGFPVLAGVIALAVGFLPKLINLIKSIFGLGAQVDKEIKKGEKDLTTLDDNAEIKDTTELKEEKVTDDQSQTVKPPAGAGETPNSSPTNFNQGGAVPGSGDTDTVPAMLTPGEFVLTKDAVKQYGVDTLYSMNAAAGGVNKSNDVPRGPNGKPMKGKSKSKVNIPAMVGSSMINNTSKSTNSVINNTSKSTNSVINNTSESMSDVNNNNTSESMSDVINNISDVTNNTSESMSSVIDNTSQSMSDVTSNISDVTNNTSESMSVDNSKSNVINNMIKPMNMGGFVNNFATDDYYETFGNVYMNRGGLVKKENIQHLKFGGMVKNLISKTPQARLLKFATNQIKKLPVPPPASKAFSALKGFGKSSASAKPTSNNDGVDSGEQIPSFDVIAPGGRAKELTLGIRR